MHMADALLSPGMGGVMWAATAIATGHSARKVQSQLDNRKISLMGVLGAFVFAAQMINFTHSRHRIERSFGRRHPYPSS